MAVNYKDLVITPFRGDASNVPVIRFSSGDATTNSDMNVRFYATSNGALSFEGPSGQMFSVTNDMTGTIFSVNDISGIPSIEVDSNGKISMAHFGGNVGIGTANAIYKLDVAGDARITGNVILGDASTDTITINGSTISLGNNQNIDAGTLFIDATNNRVGIGTTSLTTSVKANLEIRSAGAGWYHNSTSHGGLYTEFSTSTGPQFTIRTDNGSPQLRLATSGNSIVIFPGSGNVGIGTSAPTSNLHVIGTANITSNVVIGGVFSANAIPVRNINSNTSLTFSDSFIFANGNLTITLPSATTIAGRQYTIKNVGNGIITIISTSGLIDNDTNVVLEQRYSTIGLTSDGSNWYIY